MSSAEQLVLELIVPEQRENALLDLSKVGNSWCSFGFHIFEVEVYAVG